MQGVLGSEQSPPALHATHWPALQTCALASSVPVQGVPASRVAQAGGLLVEPASDASEASFDAVDTGASVGGGAPSAGAGAPSIVPEAPSFDAASTPRGKVPSARASAGPIEDPPLDPSGAASAGASASGCSGNDGRHP